MSSLDVNSKNRYSSHKYKTFLQNIIKSSYISLLLENAKCQRIYKNIKYKKDSNFRIKVRDSGVIQHSTFYAVKHVGAWYKMSDILNLLR